MFKKGDKVWSVDFGWGVIRDIIKSDTYPIRAYFASTDSFQTYTSGGRVTTKLFRSLFFEEFSIPETALKPQRWRAKEGDEYFFVGTYGTVLTGDDFRGETSTCRYNSGNYFETEKEAKESKFYRVFHEEE